MNDNDIFMNFNNISHAGLLTITEIYLFWVGGGRRFLVLLALDSCSINLALSALRICVFYCRVILLLPEHVCVNSICKTPLVRFVVRFFNWHAQIHAAADTIISYYSQSQLLEAMAGAESHRRIMHLRPLSVINDWITLSE